MKPLNLNFIFLPYFRVTNLFIVILFFLSFTNYSQNTQANTTNIMETIISAGNNATGNSGSVTYSIGQIFYTYIGESVYNVAQGIQHQEGQQAINTPDNNIEANIEILVFPNPTTDFVNLSMEGLELENQQLTYQLYDIQGRLLKQSQIDQTKTQINLSGLSPSVYILRVNVNDKDLKTFKIIKK